jgi:hypothetical protein
MDSHSVLFQAPGQQFWSMRAGVNLLFGPFYFQRKTSSFVFDLTSAELLSLLTRLAAVFVFDLLLGFELPRETGCCTVLLVFCASSECSPPLRNTLISAAGVFRPGLSTGRAVPIFLCLRYSLSWSSVSVSHQPSLATRAQFSVCVFRLFRSYYHHSSFDFSFEFVCVNCCRVKPVLLLSHQIKSLEVS